MKQKVKNEYDRLRGTLIKKGTNLYRWSHARNYPYATVVSAAKGERAGIKSVKIKKELEEFAYA